jgi:divalent metal cation (Fe/Co/Zn/Cd) transporter
VLGTAGSIPVIILFAATILVIYGAIKLEVLPMNTNNNINAMKTIAVGILINLASALIKMMVVPVLG